MVQDTKEAKKLFSRMIKINKKCYKAYEKLGLLNFYNRTNTLDEIKVPKGY